MTDLLKKNAFHWSDKVQQAFEELKEAMVNAPVMGLPDFNDEFTVEIDASGVGIGPVLQQNGHSITFLSKSLSPRYQVLSTYEKEPLAVIMALDRWRGYLLDRHFKIKTDHFSLKYILDKRITTPFQMKWLPKLLGFDYEISYKKGSENLAAYALSRVPTENTLFSILLTSVSSDLSQKIADSWAQDIYLQRLIQRLQSDPSSQPKYQWLNGQLIRKGKVVVGRDSSLRSQLVQHLHGSAVGGHAGVHKSL